MTVNIRYEMWKKSGSTKDWGWWLVEQTNLWAVETGRAEDDGRGGINLGKGQYSMKNWEPSHLEFDKWLQEKWDV